MTPDPEALEALAKRFKLKRWDVSVSGYGRSVVLATSRGKALADTWRSDVFNNQSFGHFLRHARAVRNRYKPHRFGDPITVDGKPAFFVENNSQYVRFAWPDGDFVLSSHPYDVLPEEYRPDSYRSLARKGEA